MTTVSTTQVFKSSFDLLDTSNDNAYYDFAILGNLMASANGVDGFQLFDISDPTNVTKYGTSTKIQWSHRSVLFLDGDLFVCRRQGSGAAADGGGAIDRYDVSDPASPSLVDTYSKKGPADPEWARFSYIDTDGTNIYVAGQRQGVYKFLASDLAQGPIEEILVDGTDTESQGVSVSNGFVYFDNYILPTN